jgi:hypothetical protein
MILFTSPNKRKDYKIEKGENINISLSKTNDNKNKRNFCSYYTTDFNSNLSINKAYNFTINNTIEYNHNKNTSNINNIYYISKDKQVEKKILNNKIKLINNKFNY